MGTGADNSLNIHVSISFTSWITIEDVFSVGAPVNTVHTPSLQMIS
jgi:hypothetical protein